MVIWCRSQRDFAGHAIFVKNDTYLGLLVFKFPYPKIFLD